MYVHAVSNYDKDASSNFCGITTQLPSYGNGQNSSSFFLIKVCLPMSMCDENETYWKIYSLQ